MSNRFSPGSCCCQGAAGVCSDACAGNWNNCGPSASGLLYKPHTYTPPNQELQAYVDAYDNCGWILERLTTGFFFFDQISGSAGDFIMQGQYQQLADLRRHFAFDYRQSDNKLTFSTDIEFAWLLNLGEIYGSSSLTVRMRDTSKICIVHASPLGHEAASPAQGTVVCQDGTQQAFTSPTITLAIERTIGEVIATQSTFIQVFNGTSFQSVATCADNCVCTYTIKVDGSTIATFNITQWFFAARCYDWIELTYYKGQDYTNRPPGTNPPSVETSNMAISTSTPP